MEIGEHNKTVKNGIGIFIIELVLMGIWFYWMKPESNSAMGILQIVLYLFGVNLIIGLILYFLKKPLATLFLANSILCPLIFYAIWIMWFTYWAL
tara:strand:+ start:2590 stop:2874 length:285 start_codon:yes stop_codon:yes gene_type:complete